MANSYSDSSNVPDARLHQHSGSDHAYGGYEKVNHGNGTFSMRPSDQD